MGELQVWCKVDHSRRFSIQCFSFQTKTREEKQKLNYTNMKLYTYTWKMKQTLLRVSAQWSFSPKIYGSETYKHPSQDCGFLSQQNGSFGIEPPKEQVQMTAQPLPRVVCKYKRKPFKYPAHSLQEWVKWAYIFFVRISGMSTVRCLRVWVQRGSYLVVLLSLRAVAMYSESLFSISATLIQARP